jgi:hypothetical protein
MTNFFYDGSRKEEYLDLYYGDDNKPCDYCGDVYHRIDLVYISPEYYEDSEKMIWTVKLCGPCLNVIIHEHDERNINRRKERNKINI